MQSQTRSLALNTDLDPEGGTLGHVEDLSLVSGGAGRDGEEVHLGQVSGLQYLRQWYTRHSYRGALTHVLVRQGGDRV